MIVIDDVVTTYTDRLDSHRSSWPRMVRCVCQDAYRDREVRLLFNGAPIPDEADVWIVAHPMEFTGKGVNLPNGPTPEVASRIARLLFPDRKVLSLDRQMPNYNDLVLRPRLKLDLPEVAEVCGQTPIVKLEDVVRWATMQTDSLPRVVVGDSHAVSHYERHTLVRRYDALTLHGALERGLETLMPEWALNPAACGGVKVVLGNVDIRHHLCRLDDPHAELLKLLDHLHEHLSYLSDRHGQKFTIVTPLPIEHEGRRLPKTGWYKGQPFYGSREERLDLVRSWWMWASSAECRFDTWHWPVSWYQMPGEEYAKLRMEKPNSVHLSPRWDLWDYEMNEPNPLLLDEEWEWD